MLYKLLPFEEIRNYEVRIKVIAESEYEKNHNELSYDIAYQYMEEKEGYNFVRLNKKNVRQNDKAISNLFDDILLNMGKCLYQLDILTNQTGSIVEIINWEEIKELWIAQRAKTELTYKGNIVKKFLNSMEANLMNPKIFHEMMNGDLFIYFFFYPFFREFNVIRPEIPEISNSWVIGQATETFEPYVEETNRELTLKNLIGRSDIYYTVKEQLHLTDSEEFKFSVYGHSKKHQGVIESLALMLKKNSGSQPFYSVIEGEYTLMSAGGIKEMEIEINSTMASLYKKKAIIICKLKGE